MRKTVLTLAVAALGIGLMTMSVGVAHADYPPTSTASIIVAATNPTVTPGGATPIAVVVQDSTGSRVSGVLCSFSIGSQPGSDAIIADKSATTNASGVATTTLKVGTTPGSIVVNSQCGAISGSTTVVAGVSVAPAAPAPAKASLPSTGTGSGTAANGLSAALWLALALMAFTGLGVLHAARRTGR